MRYSLRFWLILCLLALPALDLVRAEVTSGVDIIDVQYENDDHAAILIDIEAYGSVTAFASYTVELQEIATGLVRTSNQYSLASGSQRVMKLRLQLSPTLPAGEYLVKLSAQSSSGNNLVSTSANFEHQPAGAAATLPAPTSTSAPVSVNPPENSTGPGGLFFAGVAGIVIFGSAAAIWARSRMRPAGIPRTQHTVPVTKPGQPLIFISYSRTDWVQYVSPMIDRLQANGLNVWIDQHLLESGDDWLDRISNALETADRMILCISPEALESRYVKLEYRYFFNHGKKIHPLLCRPVEEMPPELEGIQNFPYERLDDLIAILEREYAVKPLETT